jgi:hypothetical protein
LSGLATAFGNTLSVVLGLVTVVTGFSNLVDLNIVLGSVTNGSKWLTKLPASSAAAPGATTPGSVSGFAVSGFVASWAASNPGLEGFSFLTFSDFFAGVYKLLYVSFKYLDSASSASIHLLSLSSIGLYVQVLESLLYLTAIFCPCQFP